ncbi:helix-turn-helix transcriptional regulator [Streptomyces gibsoniae]|uniref:LuxR C-terminal-related transcriptional regulator n=1 Tax=Streptomyces gibsoniae TaxID=3075529 RepID=A0ABU2U1R4_9ACTN|nr:LuxR C-terminal-related transcriptional regulator [Streptomyces sp. DSM 41699]MDT0467168.1 LuxR C-terminal-related transcriptional regulator [Streptomyces sp. DSM 41699]
MGELARDWPLTGRTEELQFIDRAARSGGGTRGVLLSGAAGVGKTRLARETVAAGARRGAVTRWATGTASARALPLGAFAAWTEPGGGDASRTLNRTLDALLHGAGPAGALVAVDDAHLLDDLSALLVHQLVLRQAAAVVITVRAEHPAPDAVTALWKDGHLERLEVQPLSEPQTAAALEAVLRGPVDSTTAGRLWKLTRGNALILRHVVESELKAGNLRRVRGTWRWSGTPSVSPVLADLVATRMGELSGRLRDVVDLLALGEPFDIALLAQLADPAAIEEAEARGLVTVEQAGDTLWAGLAHPLYGEARRAALGTLRARRLRGRMATALAGHPEHHGDNTLRRAVLAVDSDLPPDPVLFTEAAAHAALLMDMALVERLARGAVAAGAGFEAQLLVTTALAATTRHDDVKDELAVLSAMAVTDAELVRATLVRVPALAYVTSGPAEAEAVLEEAESRVEQDGFRLQLTALRAYLEATQGRLARAVECATTALAAPELPGEPVILASVGLVAALAVTGRADDMAPAAARGHEAAVRSSQLGFLRAPLIMAETTGLILAGYLREAEDLAAGFREEVRDQEFGNELSGFIMGDAELGRGRVADATRRLREALVGLREHGNAGGFVYFCLLSLTRALALAGDLPGARSSLAELEAERSPSFAVLDPELALVRAWVTAVEGALSDAITLAHEGADGAARRGQYAHEVLALQTAVCLGDASVAARLAELAGRVDGPRVRAAAAHAAALSTGDGEGLRAVSVRWEETGDLLSAADAAAQSASTHLRRGERAPAHAAAARAHRLAQACQGVRTPALLEAARPVPLTRREREIAVLVARGLTNQQIADRLVVSVRTVEGHLYRIGNKLGLTNRRELAALLLDG